MLFKLQWTAKDRDNRDYINKQNVAPFHYLFLRRPEHLATKT